MHAAIEAHYRGTPLEEIDILNYQDAYFQKRDDIDWDYIMHYWEVTANLLIASSPTAAPDAQEYQTLYEIDDEVTVGGTVDYRRDKILGDYKTCKTIPKTVGDYKWQMMLYAFADKQKGIDTHTLQVTYIQRADEGYDSPKTGKRIGVKKPATAIVDYIITQDDWIEIEEAIKLCADTYKLVKANPSIAHLVYRHNPLSFRQ